MVSFDRSKCFATRPTNISDKVLKEGPIETSLLVRKQRNDPWISAIMGSVEPNRNVVHRFRLWSGRNGTNHWCQWLHNKFEASKHGFLLSEKTVL
jgi:hypothetical protein